MKKYLFLGVAAIALAATATANVTCNANDPSNAGCPVTFTRELTLNKNAVANENLSVTKNFQVNGETKVFSTPKTSIGRSPTTADGIRQKISNEKPGFFSSLNVATEAYNAFVAYKTKGLDSLVLLYDMDIRQERIWYAEYPIKYMMASAMTPRDVLNAVVAGVWPLFLMHSRGVHGMTLREQFEDHEIKTMYYDTIKNFAIPLIEKATELQTNGADTLVGLDIARNWQNWVTLMTNEVYPTVTFGNYFAVFPVAFAHVYKHATDNSFASTSKGVSNAGALFHRGAMAEFPPWQKYIKDARCAADNLCTGGLSKTSKMNDNVAQKIYEYIADAKAKTEYVFDVLIPSNMADHMSYRDVIAVHLYTMRPMLSKVLTKPSYDHVTGKATYQTPDSSNVVQRHYAYDGQYQISGVGYYYGNNSFDPDMASYDNITKYIKLRNANKIMSQFENWVDFLAIDVLLKQPATAGRIDAKFGVLADELVAFEKKMYETKYLPLMAKIADQYFPYSDTIKNAVDDDYPGMFRWFFKNPIKGHPHLPHDASSNIREHDAAGNVGAVIVADDANLTTDGTGMVYRYLNGTTVPSTKLVPVARDDPKYYDKLPLYKRGDALYSTSLSLVTGFSSTGKVPAFGRKDSYTNWNTDAATDHTEISDAYTSKEFSDPTVLLPDKLAQAGAGFGKYFDDIGDFHARQLVEKLKNGQRTLLDDIEAARRVKMPGYKTNMRLALEGQTWGQPFVAKNGLPGGSRSIGPNTYTKLDGPYIRSLWSSQQGAAFGAMSTGTTQYDSVGFDVPLRSDVQVLGTHFTGKFNRTNPAHTNWYHPDYFTFVQKEHYKHDANGSLVLTGGKPTLLSKTEFADWDLSLVANDVRLAFSKNMTKFDKCLEANVPGVTCVEPSPPQGSKLTFLYRQFNDIVRRDIEKAIVAVAPAVLPPSLRKYVLDRNRYEWGYLTFNRQWSSGSYYLGAKPEGLVITSGIPTEDPDATGHPASAIGVLIHETIIGHGLQSIINHGERYDELWGVKPNNVSQPCAWNEKGCLTRKTSEFKTWGSTSNFFPRGGQVEGWAVYGEFFAWELKLEPYRVTNRNPITYGIETWEPYFDDLTVILSLAGTSRVAARLVCDTGLHYSKNAYKFGRVSDDFFERTKLTPTGWDEVVQRIYGGPTQSTHYALGYLCDVYIFKKIKENPTLTEKQKNLMIRDYHHVILIEGTKLAPNVALFEYFNDWYTKTIDLYKAFSDASIDDSTTLIEEPPYVVSNIIAANGFDVEEMIRYQQDIEQMKDH